ncbi:MAG: TRAP transporter small permease [Lautropia sp.]
MFTRIDRFATAIAGILLLATAMLTFGDVLGRNVFGRPLPGATELTELALVGMTFLIYPRLALRQQHLVIDLFDRYMGVAARRLQQCASGVCGAVLFGAIGWRLWILGGRASGYGDVTAYLQIPLAPAYWFMSVLAVITALAFAVLAVLAFRIPADQLAAAEPAKPSGLD